ASTSSKTNSGVRMKHIISVASVFLLATGLQAFAQQDDPPSTNWPQWGQNPQHQGAVTTVGQSLHSKLAEKVYDPFVPQEQADQGGDLLAHYQATILHQQDAYMMFKSGTYTPAQFDADGNQLNVNQWDSQIWNEKRLHWEGGQLVEKWNFQSD